MTIYFDLRSSPDTGLKALETEDVSVDILVALVKFYLDQGVPVAVRAPGRTVYSFRGDTPSSFQRFYLSTMELLFQPTISPAALYQLDKRGYESTSAIIISHLLDPAVFSTVEGSLTAETPIALILNRSAYAQAERKAAVPYLYSLSERGANIRFVDGSEDIVESLEKILCKTSTKLKEWSLSPQLKSMHAPVSRMLVCLLRTSPQEGSLVLLSLLKYSFFIMLYIV